jgi:hypothetical protein
MLKFVIILFFFIVMMFGFGLYQRYAKVNHIAPMKIVMPFQSPKNVAFELPEKRLWKYECVDTMKTSRDKAREWKDAKEFEERIEKEMKIISEMGADCVAIDTPYDDEFLPVLEKWVASARKYNLVIWFRGNFSQWEHWFGYSGEMSEGDLFVKTKRFVSMHPELFRDKDIFTPAPEGENGGPFDQVEIDEYPRFRKFLIDQYEMCKEAFAGINRDVVCNWYSMNGGLAKRMLDADTVKKLDDLVTIDHYIKTSPEMGEFIRYFKDKFGAKTAVGEFGAPIPDINGTMSPKQQADFIKELFDELYVHKNDLVGISYWDLYDGSTRLVESDYSPRPAIKVIENYLKPGVVYGQVTNSNGDVLTGVELKINGGKDKVYTDEMGRYYAVVPAGETSIVSNLDPYISLMNTVNISHDEELRKDLTLHSKNPTFWEQFQGN